EMGPALLEPAAPRGLELGGAKDTGAQPRVPQERLGIRGHRIVVEPRRRGPRVEPPLDLLRELPRFAAPTRFEQDREEAHRRLRTHVLVRFASHLGEARPRASLRSGEVPLQHLERAEPFGGRPRAPRGYPRERLSPRLGPTEPRRPCPNSPRRPDIEPPDPRAARHRSPCPPAAAGCTARAPGGSLARDR